MITWFQNRRAKLKRDLEELKADVTAAKHLSDDESPMPHVDETQLLNRHGLKRVTEKKATQVTSLAASNNDGASITIPDDGLGHVDVTHLDSAYAQSESRQYDQISVTSPGSYTSAHGSPDSTTHPQDLSFKHHRNSPSPVNVPDTKQLTEMEEEEELLDV